MFGSMPSAAAGARNQWSCRHVAVRMSADAGTLAGRIANILDAEDRAYPWYDVIYVGNGIGWGLDNKHVQRHFCIPKGWNASTTERQIGTIRFGRKDGQQSASAYEIVSSATQGTNDDDPNNKARLKLVTNPYKPGSQCLLMRVRSIDPNAGTYRSALRMSGGGNSYSSYLTDQATNQLTADCVPREKEVWFAGAYLYGDQAGWDQGEAESWAGFSQTSQYEVMGWQLHGDNGKLGRLTGASSETLGGPFAPQFFLGMNFVSGGAESAHTLTIRISRPATQGQTHAANYISKSLSGAPGATQVVTLWNGGNPYLRSKWLGFVVCMNQSITNDGYIRIWHDTLDSYVANAAPTQIVNHSGWNDWGVGRKGVGYVGNPDGSTFDVQNHRGDPYHCFETYIAGAMGLPSITMRCVPVRPHFKNPARTEAQYAADVMTLLKASVY